MSNEKKIIMYDSPEAAKPYTMDGWVSSKGNFYREESIARYDGATHRVCPCGEIMSKHWTLCEACRNKAWTNTYLSYPLKSWDEASPVYDHTTDHYFFDGPDEIREYYEEEELDISTVRLSLCEGNKPCEVDAGFWEDIMPEEWDDIPKDISKALDDLNRLLRDSKPWSYSPGNNRVDLPPLTPNPAENE